MTTQRLTWNQLPPAAKRLLVRFTLLVSTFALVVSTVLSACFLKPAARTANDLARATCETFADARERQLGMSAEQWCGLHDNLDPFLQTILAAERRAGIANSGHRPPNESRDDAPPAP